MRFLIVAALLLCSATAFASPPAPPLNLNLRLAFDDSSGGGSTDGAKSVSNPSSASDLDFDLLGKAEPPPVAPEDSRLKLRRSMLTIHQTAGMALLVSTASTLVLGQLNYSDRFAGASTGKYEAAHAVLSYTTLGLFGSTGLIALLAPVPIEKQNQGFDRVTLHKVGMFSATAGMAAQAALGIYTVAREGYVNQKSFATAHLVVGYFTFAAMALGVGAIVF